MRGGASLHCSVAAPLGKGLSIYQELMRRCGTMLCRHTTGSSAQLSALLSREVNSVQAAVCTENPQLSKSPGLVYLSHFRRFLVWLNFCHWLAERFSEAALRPGATPKAGRLTVVWTFPLSSSVIVRCEVQSSILMKWRTSSAHFNCQRVSNG